ncbi:DUF1793-domain-containing protein [Schizopora paradoxa]|uniref:DUF1793-domain-containing protein n=1 Tax=Schizopora paradoxa TaxID=27342 RepID=A0A0H2RS96_9AGAM|nr:DUF1793-domain-containing protein [Schizopora paradoxa]
MVAYLPLVRGILSILLFSCFAAAQTNLPSWPLAVKGPFFNSWYRGGEHATSLPNTWPVNWSAHEMGWYCAIIVDEIPYRLMGGISEIGDPQIATATQLGVELTPTRTIFAMQAGPMLVNLTFFSPVTPADLTRQSMPFSYLYSTVVSSDSSNHSVRIYSDIVADWISGDDSLPVTAAGSIENDTVILSTQLQNSIGSTVIGGRASDATAFYSIKMSNASNVSYQIGSDLRSSAINSSNLANTVQSSALNTRVYFLFTKSTANELGMLVDLGSVSSRPASTVWSIGVYRDPVVLFGTLSGELQNRSSYFMANFSTPQEVISFFLDDFENAVIFADDFDAKLISDANLISSTYRDLVIPFVRQILGTIDITISMNSDGSWNTTDVLAFMYDLGMLGANGANPVDILYAAFPAFLYLNPEIGGHLLRPLLQLQDSSLYTQAYAAQNLGVGYPNVSVHNYVHNFGIEDSASMIIMSLAYLQASGDDSLVSQHYNLLKGWSNYLVSTALNPGTQTTSSSDFITMVNQTNLSLKGIIGIAAMANISDHLGNSADSSRFQAIASSYIKQWQSLATSSGNERLTSAFGEQDSGGLIYNLCADKLLNMNLVSDEIYQMQSSFYKMQFSSSLNALGMPLDSSNPNITRADWIMFSAAAVGDNSTRDDMITAVHQYMSSGVNSLPLGPLYDPITGLVTGGSSSPAMGAMFAMLAVQNAGASTGSNGAPATSSDFTTRKSPSTKIIVEAVIGGVVGALMLFACIYKVYLRRGASRRGGSKGRPTPYAGVDPHTDIAFAKMPEAQIFRSEKNRGTFAYPHLDRLPTNPQSILPTNSELSLSTSYTSSPTVLRQTEAETDATASRSAQAAIVSAFTQILSLLAANRDNAEPGASVSVPPPTYAEH